MERTYETIATISFALALLFFVISLIFFLRFDIWRIIGELSGRTAKKSIERIKASGEAASGKNQAGLQLFFSKGRISEALGNLGANKKAKGSAKETPANKEAVYTGGTNITEDLPDEYSTEILQETLEEESVGTELLNPEKESARLPVEIKVIEEVTIIHTKDVIK
ncbi:hypothetical protein ACPWSR_04025 [Alloiococcus sp. CFN-8]|uniref:hypothetical protein n=1 Tax=Alloiococcus sp. CFN-8 TaxID=3416081 RepID=UPI003CEEA1FF